MITISLCMIVKNEERILARCLDSLKGIAEEIIIVDTGSTDRTKEIAARYTDHIYDFTYSSSNCRSLFIFYKRLNQQSTLLALLCGEISGDDKKYDWKN